MRIRAVSTYIPSSVVDNIEQGKSFGEGESFIRNRIGALCLPRKDNSEETSDMAAKALINLAEKASLPLEKIQALVLVTQNGDGEGLPQTSSIIQHKMGMRKDIAAFDISLGCSGYVYGLVILKAFMQSLGLTEGVLITCDPYSKIIDPTDKNTALLFGDAASATWMAEDGDWEILSSVYYTDGAGAAYLKIEEGRLKMNGRQIFNFAVSQVPRQIEDLLEKERLCLKDIDIFSIHQGSAAIVREIGKRFPLVRDRFVDYLMDTGNTVSTSIPLILEKYFCKMEIKKILISGFGVGLSLASTILQRREKNNADCRRYPRCDKEVMSTN